MNFPTPKPAYDGYCGTSYAAKVLGISVGTVQGLVEKNELKAWKTHGGHRRISLQSLQDYQRRNNLVPASLIHGENCLRVMVVEDEEVIRIMLQHQFDQWALPIDVVMYGSAMEALVDMPSWQPQVLLTDLRMPGIDGFQLLKTLKEHALFASMAVVVLTGLSDKEIEQSGGLPEGVTVMRKPVDAEWLKGFFDALMSVRQINNQHGQTK